MGTVGPPRTVLLFFHGRQRHVGKVRQEEAVGGREVVGRYVVACGARELVVTSR